MATLKGVLPSHLKPSSASGDDDYQFTGRRHGKSRSHMAFENASTSIAAAQMRNALNGLSDTVQDPELKEAFDVQMDNFFQLFRRYLNDKAKGNAVDWDRIAPPDQSQVVDYDSMAN